MTKEIEMLMTKPAAQDLAADLLAKSHHMAEINEGDWAGALDAADAVEAALIAAAGADVEVPEDAVDVAKGLDLL